VSSLVKRQKHFAWRFQTSSTSTQKRASSLLSTVVRNTPLEFTWLTRRTPLAAVRQANPTTTKATFTVAAVALAEEDLAVAAVALAMAEGDTAVAVPTAGHQQPMLGSPESRCDRVALRRVVFCLLGQELATRPNQQTSVQRSILRLRLRPRAIRRSKRHLVSPLTSGSTRWSGCSRIVLQRPWCLDCRLPCVKRCVVLQLPECLRPQPVCRVPVEERESVICDQSFTWPASVCQVNIAAPAMDLTVG